MFRVVLTYQLVLMLLAGPMLCCCTAAQLGCGRDTQSASPVSTTSVKSVYKSCCGKQKPSHASSPAPGQQPSHPSKCPCKEGSTKVVAVPTAPTPSGDVLTILVSDLVLRDHPVTTDESGSAVQAVRRCDRHGSGLTTADLLYAHHKLRC
jgi:hypothetical protein